MAITGVDKEGDIIFITEDGEIATEMKQAITALFPDDVRVDFFNTHLPGVQLKRKGKRIS